MQIYRIIHPYFRVPSQQGTKYGASTWLGGCISAFAVNPAKLIAWFEWIELRCFMALQCMVW